MNAETGKITKIRYRGVRDSGLELFRIITMLVIVAHHYFVNSGLKGLVYDSSELSGNSIFLLIFG